MFETPRGTRSVTYPERYGKPQRRGFPVPERHGGAGRDAGRNQSDR